MGRFPLETRAIAVTLGVAGTVLVGLIDDWTGPELSSTLLYLGPIAFVAWYGGLWASILISAVSAEVWLAAELLGSTRDSVGAGHYWNAALEFAVFLVFACVFSQLRDRLRRERAFAREDALTGLSNRRAFLEAVAHEVERTHRISSSVTAIYMDVDDFKSINDRLGHDAGDAVLKGVGAAIRRSIRTVDVAARLGGDEFSLFLPDTDQAMAGAFVTRLRDNLLASTRAPGLEPTFSIGVVTFLTPPPGVADVLRAADVAMYRAKRSGKNATRYEVAPLVLAPTGST